MNTLYSRRPVLSRLISSRLISSSLLAAGSALGLALLAAPFAASADDLPARIRIGELMSISGAAASASGGLHTAVRLAVKEINEKGGIAGHQIDLIQGDDGSDPTQAVNEARRLITREKVNVMFGPVITTNVLPVMPIYNEAKIASVINSGSSAFTPKIAPYGFSDYFSSDAYAKAMVDYVADTLKAKRVGIIADNSAQSKGVVADYEKYIAARGLVLSGAAEHEFRATDVTPQLLDLKRGNPDALIQQTGTGEDGGLTFKTMDEMGWKIPVASSVAAVLAANVLKTGGPDIFKSGRITGLTFKAFTYCPGDPMGKSDFAGFLARVKALDPGNYDKVNLYGMSFMYDGVYLMKAAIEATHSVDGPTIASWIEKNAASVHAVSGRFGASPTSHFLFGAESVFLVPRPDIRREDGLMQRAGC